MSWQVLVGVILGAALGYGGGWLAPRWMGEPPKPQALWSLVGINAIATGFLALQHPLNAYFWHQVLFVAILSLAAFVDVYDRIIPNEVVLFGLAAWVLLMVIAPYPEKSWLQALGGGVAGFVFFYLLAVLVPGGMGLGDVKLALVMGLFMGIKWIGMGLVIAFLVGGLISGLLLATKRLSRKSHIPFGPFLAAGGMITVIWGWPLWVWYLGW